MHAWDIHCEQLENTNDDFNTSLLSHHYANFIQFQDVFEFSPLPFVLYDHIWDNKMYIQRCIFNMNFIYINDFIYENR